MTKIIQSAGFIGKIIGNKVGNLGTKPLIDLSIPFVKDVLHKWSTKSISSILDNFKRNMSEQGAVRAG